MLKLSKQAPQHAVVSALWGLLAGQVPEPVRLPVMSEGSGTKLPEQASHGVSWHVVPQV